MKVCPTCQRSYPTTFAVCPQDGARLTEGQEWSAGALIRGKYRIVEKIGEGGMGAVYKATHMHFNEPCALKVMAPQLLNDTALVKRFGREAIVARKLRHRNAVRVEDFDEAEDGRPFIVMEYIEGQSLKNLMSVAGPLPPARVCSIIKQAAAALHAAHQLGLVHRDIKPDNIVLVQTGAEDLAKVLDFGIAKVRDAQSAAGSTLTETGMVIGTPPYMSPEQARGANQEELDGRSDIYSLGVVMYQMLTGVLPLQADTPMNMLLAQIQTPPTPISHARPGVRIPAPLGNLVMQCLEKDRGKRPQTGAALIEELERCEQAQEAAPAMDNSLVFSPEGTTISDTPSRLAARASEAARPSHAAREIERTPKASPVREETMPAGSSRGSPPAGTAAVNAGVQVASGAAGAAGNTGRVSRGALAGLATVLVIVAAGGVWFLRHRPVPQPQVVPDAGHRTVGEVAKPSVGPSDSQPTKPDQHAVEKSGVAAGPPKLREQTKPAVPELSAAEKADRAKKVASTIALGDLYFDNGEYDNAIKEYQLGLDADPSNTMLQERVARAHKAKEPAKP